MSVPVVKVSVLTTPPSLKLKLLPKPVVQVKMLSRFPANVAAISPVLLDRTGGNYTFSIDLNEIIANLPPAGVSSVFGRSGAVTAQSGDYTFAQIGSTPTTLSGYGITDAQPLDIDLTAIAALITTSFGRGYLTLADASASRTYLSLVPGTDIQAYDSDLAALAANSTNGLWARTGSGTGATRTITAPVAGITVSNGDGVSGNPTLALANDLSALEGLSSTGLAARTGTDAWAQRTITGPASGITVTNGSGASGNPTLALANDLSALEGLSSTGFAARTTTDTWAQRTITGTANAISVTNGDGVSGNPTLAISTDAALPGNPTTTTQSALDNSTKIATTAYVDSAVTAGGGGGGGPRGFVNRVINYSGQINQNGSGTASDGTYWFDQWVHLNESNPVTPSQLTNVENGTPYMIRTTQSNASAQRFGIIQPIESINCIDLRGKAVALSARVRMSASTTLRYAIVEWTGTADTVTKDVVNSWSSGTFTPGNFFISTTTTIVATGSTALTANTLASISLTGTVSSSMNNLHVFFWTDSQQAQNVTLDIGKVQLEEGSAATSLAARSIQDEFNLCYRYLFVTGSSGNSIGTWLSSTAAFMVGALPVPMRTTSPTASIFGGGSTVSVECFGSGTSTSTSAFPGASQTTWNLNVNTLSPARSANAPAFNKNAFVIKAQL